MVTKRTPLIILTFLMILPFTLTSSASTYTDAQPSDWFYEALSKVSDHDIINGFPDGSFKPNEALTSDQLIKILCELKGYKLPIADGYWAQNFINKGIELNWFTNLTITDYRQPITRANAMLLISNAMTDLDEYPNMSDYSIYIGDYSDIPHIYRNSVLKTYANGLIDGYPDTSFRASNTLTRAEGATILYRIIDENQRLTPADPTKAISIDRLLSDSNNSAFDFTDEAMTFYGGRYTFFDSKDDEWKPLKATNLTEDSQERVNLTLDSIIPMLSKQSDLFLNSTYSYNEYLLTLSDRDDLSKIQLSIKDQLTIQDQLSPSTSAHKATMLLGNIRDDESEITNQNKALIKALLNEFVTDSDLAMYYIQFYYGTFSHLDQTNVIEVSGTPMTFLQDHEYFIIYID